tara:strand:- start:96 stop:269 length:174 start_codon:yes stop_codon:yes gene_type:complete
LVKELNLKKNKNSLNTFCELFFFEGIALEASIGESSGGKSRKRKAFYRTFVWFKRLK